MDPLNFFSSSKNSALDEESFSPAALRVHKLADTLFADFAALLLEWKSSPKEEAALTGHLIPLKKSGEFDKQTKVLLGVCQKILFAKLEATRSLQSVPAKVLEEFYFIPAKAKEEILRLKEEIGSSKFYQTINSVEPADKETQERCLKMSPEDFQKEFFDSDERGALRNIALEKIKKYKNSFYADLPKARERLFKMLACDDLTVQQQAVKELAELIERDPLAAAGSDKLMQLHDDILALLDEGKRKYLHPSLLPAVIRLYALTLELILLYNQPGFSFIVMDETKDKAWSNAEVLLQINSSNDPEIKFWGDYAKECAKNLQTQTTETDEWLMRLRYVLRATTTVTMAFINHDSIVSTIESCVDDLKKATYHLEFKKDWFFPVITTKKLCHLSLHNPAAFQQITPLIQKFKQGGCPELLQGMIMILESVALLTEDRGIQEEVLKLLIQYAHLQDEAVSYRLVKALSRICNHKLQPLFSNTAYFLVRLIGSANMIVGKEAQTLLESVVSEWGDRSLEKLPYFETIIKYFLKGFSDKKLADHEGGKSPINALVPSARPEIPSILSCLAELPLRAAEPDEHGNTPYHLAARGGYSRLVVQIYESKLQINIDEQEFTSKNTALHEAAFHGFKNTCQALINAKANPHIKNGEGNTALHLAVMQNCHECVKALMGARGDPRALNQEGKTPVDLAIQKDYAQILETLIKDNLFNDTLAYAASIIGAAKTCKVLSLQVLLTPISTIPSYATLEINKMLSKLEGEAKKGFNLFHQSKLANDRDYKASFQRVESVPHTPLDYAAADFESSHLIPALLEANNQVNRVNYLGLSPLHIAVLYNNVKGVKILLTHKMNVNTPDEIRKFTPMHLAVYLRNGEMIDLLLEHEPDLNAQTIFGDTPLHMLPLKNAVEDRIPLYPPLHDKSQPKNIERREDLLLMKLLEKVDTEALPVDCFGNNLLHLVVLNNLISLVPVLTKKCPSLFWQRNQNQQLPIEAAIGLVDIWPMIRALMEGVMESELKDQKHTLNLLSDLFFEKTEGRVPLLHILAAAKLLEPSKNLLADYPGAAVIKDCSYTKKTALHVAAKIGFTPLIALYKEHNYLQVVDHFSNTAGHISILKEMNDFAKQWVLAGGDIQAKNNNGHTLAHLAALKGSVELLEFLRAQGATFDQPDARGSFPLHLAAMNGFDEAVVFLLKHFPEGMDKPDEEGMTPLHQACLCPHILQEDGVRESTSKITPKKHIPLIHLPVGWPFAKKVTPKSGTSLQTIISRASAHRSFTSPGAINPKEVLIHLILKGANPELQDASGITPLMLAAASGQAPLVKILLGLAEESLPDFKGVDIRKKDYDLRTALHHATLEEQVEVVSILLVHDASLARPKEKAIASSKDINLVRPLHLIAKRRNGYREHKDQLVEISKLFIVKGRAELGAADENGKTEVHWAAENGLNHLVSHFLDLTHHSAYKEQRLAQIAPDRQGRTPLHYAAINNFDEVVGELLQRGLSPNIKDSQGMTPLMHMSKFGLTPAAKKLIVARSDLKACDKNKNTIVHLILQKEQINDSDKALLLEVLRRDPDLSISCNSSAAGKMYPIHVAAEQGHTEMIHFLVRYMGKNREAQVEHLWNLDGQGRNAGMIAESRGNKLFAETWRTIKKRDLKEGWHRGPRQTRIYPLPLPEITGTEEESEPLRRWNLFKKI